jgi:aspartate/methionine/tyrosine aminotransferase
MAKRSSSRPKKLKLVDRSPVGMTTAEALELSELYRPLSHLSGSSPRTDSPEKLRKIAFDRFLYIYIEALCNDAKVENAGSTKRGIASLRAKIIKSIRKEFGRDLSPDDIIKELAKQAPVPTYAKDAIRRDYLRITV